MLAGALAKWLAKKVMRDNQRGRCAPGGVGGSANVVKSDLRLPIESQFRTATDGLVSLIGWWFDGIRE